MRMPTPRRHQLGPQRRRQLRGEEHPHSDHRRHRRHEDRQVAEVERPRPSALVLFWWWLRSKRGLTTVGVLAALAVILRPQGRLGRWLKEQVGAMAEVALSVRY